MVRARIFYQTDPAVTIAGGIDTFIRGMLKAAPADIELSVVGLTTDPPPRPVRRCAKGALAGRGEGGEAYRSRYPHLADCFRFIPTWMDPDVFFPAREPQARGERVVVSVGRLDSQKNPLLLIDGFALLARRRADVRLVV